MKARTKTFIGLHFWCGDKTKIKKWMGLYSRWGSLKREGEAYFRSSAYGIYLKHLKNISSLL